MEPRIRGIHHVTATVDDAQTDLDFYTGILGLRLVKKTVNFDNTGVYHFYYGNAIGDPGTIMTTFPYKGKGVRAGVKGTGQITRTAFSVPVGSLSFWKSRLSAHGVETLDGSRRFGEEVLPFLDPSGLVLEFIANDHDGRTPWRTGEIGAAYAIRGFYSVALDIRNPGPTRELLRDVLGFVVVGDEDGFTRFGVEKGDPGQLLDVFHAAHGEPGVNGIGTVHHVALAVNTDEEQLALREKLLRLGYQVTEVRDRQYFRSIYFREPGGVLFEIATAGPGFAIDEDETSLGQDLKLPPWEEENRASIASTLPPVALARNLL